MSEVQTRPSASRGRVSTRGGRGGHSSRGGRGSRSAKGDNSDNVAGFEDEGEIGQMKKKYASDLPMLKELFHDWSDEDLVFALEDADGSIEEAIDRITEGNVSQWGEVKKKSTDRNRPKTKEAQSIPTETPTAPVRGGRGRAGFESRGRARGDRGRGGRGGRAGAQTNGTRGAEKPALVPAAIPTTETTAWSSVAESGASAKTEQPSDSQTAATEPVDESTDSAPKSSVIPEGTKKGWASLFAKPTPPPQPKPAMAPAPAPEKPAVEPVVEQKAPEPEPEPTPAPAPAAAAPAPAPAPAPIPIEKAPEPAIPKTAPTTEALAPPTTTAALSKDDLTKTNLEQIPDASHPAPTATQASTMGSTFDTNNFAATATPRGTPSTYHANALRQSARGPGLQRRVMEQQEAVVMPGNHAVDRAAVQFGSMGLNGDTSTDVDENREEAETRAQPPQHSPVAPRASLPPATQPQGPTETPVVSRPAPGLPPVPQVTTADNSFNDFARYTDAHKPYDPFSHQVSQAQPQIQEPFANQAPIQPAAATTASEYSPFYAVDQRIPYNYYGAAYGQSQDASVAQRAAAGFGASGAEVQPHVPTTQPPSRYGHADAPNSGHTTPNPTLPGATQTPTTQQMPGQGAYGYGYPYYSNPQYAAYMNQVNQTQYGRNRPMYDDARRYEDHYMPHNNQFGYGSQYAPYAKTGMYGQPHAGFSYDHASSPATAASFSQAMPGRDSVYGRAGSAQPSEAQQTAAGANAFGTGMDVFGRTPAGFGQNQPITQQPPVTAEETKSFDTPKAGGPSPSLAQANRPGSASNSVPGQPQAQTGLPPLQAQQGQQAFGTYPHLNPQYGGLGVLGGHQGAAANHQAAGYGNYGGGAGFANYYGNTGRGWGGNYGH